MKRAEILIYEPIGYDWWTDSGITAKSFAEQLTAADVRAGDELLLRVNSPGGSIFDGGAIFDTLRACPATKIARIEGLAASAASYIVQACDQVEIGKASYLMVHQVWDFAMGNATDFRKAAADLDVFDNATAKLYAERSGRSLEEIQALMAAETWLDGPAAVEAKLVDRLTPAGTKTEDVEAPVSQRFLDRFQKMPPAARAFLRPIAQPLAPAASLRLVRNEGRALNKENRDRLTQIKDLAQAALDSDSTSSTNEGSTEDATARAVSCLEPRLQTLEALVGLR